MSELLTIKSVYLCASLVGVHPDAGPRPGCLLWAFLAHPQPYAVVPGLRLFHLCLYVQVAASSLGFGHGCVDGVFVVLLVVFSLRLFLEGLVVDVLGVVVFFGGGG